MLAWWSPRSTRPVPEPKVRTVRVTISPDNVASCQLAPQYGLAEVGQQRDGEDGLEIVDEVDASSLFTLAVSLAR
jgi:hypothetical protein